MEFKHIEYFVETCNHESFSKAAGCLFISQQALSRCIANLEKELGCALFTRGVQGIELTAEGNYLNERFRPIVKSFQDAAGQTVSYLGNRPVRLPFCCAPGIIRNISPELLISFGEQYPNIKLEMMELSDKQCEEYIHEDKSHFGLLLGREWKDRSKHNWITVKTEPSYLLVHKDHPLAGCPSVSLAQLRDERVLTLDKTSYLLEDINHAVAPFDFTIKPFYESADVMQLCALVGKGKGVQICIRQIYEESGLNNVVLVPLVERTVDYRIAFAFLDYDALDSAARQFIEFILENIKRDAAADAQPSSPEGV
jgi:DNA-binding transcriptional LysR family regulator